MTEGVLRESSILIHDRGTEVSPPSPPPSPARGEGVKVKGFEGNVQASPNVLR